MDGVLHACLGTRWHLGQRQQTPKPCRCQRHKRCLTVPPCAHCGCVGEPRCAVVVLVNLLATMTVHKSCAGVKGNANYSECQLRHSIDMSCWFCAFPSQRKKQTKKVNNSFFLRCLWFCFVLREVQIAGPICTDRANFNSVPGCGCLYRLVFL